MSPYANSHSREETVLLPLVKAVRTNRLLIALVLLATIAGSIFYLSVRSPSYSASADILVAPLPQDDLAFLGISLIRDSGDPTRTLQTAATIIESPASAAEAARRLGDDRTGEEVLTAVEVEPQGESNILAVTATADSAEGAAELANTFAGAAVEERESQLNSEIETALQSLEADSGEPNATTVERINRLEEILATGDPTLSVSQPAEIPQSSDEAGPALILIVAGLAGTTLGIGAALLLQLFDRRIRDEEDLQATYPLPILSSVPLVGKGIQGDSPWNVPPDISEPFRTLAFQLEMRKTKNHVVMVTSPSQGDGKTTASMQLAIALAATGRSVILFDFDLRKPDLARRFGLATRNVRFDPDAGLASMLSPVPEVPSLNLLSTPKLDGEYSQSNVHDTIVSLLDRAAQVAEYVVVDTAPLGEVGDALQVIEYIDDIIVVARAGHTDERSLAITAGLLERSGNAPIGYIYFGSTKKLHESYYSYGMAQGQKLAEQHPERHPIQDQ